MKLHVYAREGGGRILTSLFCVPSSALCVTRYGAIPFGEFVANILGALRLSSMDDVDYPEIPYVHTFIAKGTAAMLGGPSLWGTVIKIKSRVLPLIYGPRRILSGECPFRKLYMYK